MSYRRYDLLSSQDLRIVLGHPTTFAGGFGKNRTIVFTIVNRKARRKRTEIERLRQRSRLQPRSLLSNLGEEVSLGQVSLGHHPSDIRESVYFTMDFEAIGKYEVDREHDAKKGGGEREKERETNIKVIVGWGRG